MRAIRVESPGAGHRDLRGQKSSLKINHVGDDFRTSGRPLQGIRHKTIDELDEPGVLIFANGGATVPVNCRASESEVDCRHGAAPVHELVRVRETVRVFHRDQFPFGVWPRDTASAEHSTGQEHTVGCAARFRSGDVRVRVVNIKPAEDGVLAVRFIEQVLQCAGIDAPAFLRDVTGRASLAIRSLNLEELACEIDGAFGAERCRLSTRVRQQLIIRHTEPEPGIGQCDRTRAQVVCEPQRQNEQHNYGGGGSYTKTSAPGTKSLYRKIAHHTLPTFGPSLYSALIIAFLYFAFSELDLLRVNCWGRRG